MRFGPLAVATLVACALGVVNATAQDGHRVEVTPYVALGTPGASPIGTSVTFPITRTFSIESDVAYRRGEGNINALSTNASLLYLLPRAGRSIPYLAGGVGLAQYGAPVFGKSGPPIGTVSRLQMTMNAGGGLKTALNDELDLRTDVRWFKSFGREGSEQFRVAQGVSFDVGGR